jgi:hypothetical protein
MAFGVALHLDSGVHKICALKIAVVLSNDEMRVLLLFSALWIVLLRRLFGLSLLFDSFFPPLCDCRFGVSFPLSTVVFVFLMSLVFFIFVSMVIILDYCLAYPVFCISPSLYTLHE